MTCSFMVLRSSSQLNVKYDLKKLLQLACVGCVSVGISYEIMTGATLGYILITAGALAFAISTKVKNGL